MRSASRLLAAWSCLGLTAACLQPMRSAAVDADELDHRVTRHVYLEEGALVALGVSVEATRRREKSPLVPLGLVLANNGAPRLSVNRESFTLIDDAGRRYPMAGLGEFGSLGRQPVVDLQVSARFGEIFANRYQALNLVPSVFFPIAVTEPGQRRRGVVADKIDLPRQHWLIDVIYFPHPEGELLGRNYELWFTARELEDPVFVRFRVD